MSKIKDKKIYNFLNKGNYNKILIISGKQSFIRSGAKKLIFKFTKNKKRFIFLKKNIIPQFEELKSIISFKEKIKPDLIVAIGGGCVMDYAKIASVFKISNDLIERVKYSNFNNLKTTVLAIPTTAGSGAEVTSNAVIYIKNHKYSVEGSKIKPDYYYLNSSLILSSKIKNDASSGMDAICQATESLFSVKSNKRSVEYAKKALKILFKNYSNFLRKKNKKNSYKMLLGANYAGKAINISKTTLPHAVSYPFTSHFNIAHGHAVSLTINKFLNFIYFNQEKNSSTISISERFKILFKLTNTYNIIELDNYFLRIKRISNLEQDFNKLGINVLKKFKIISNGINNRRLKNNPIPVTLRNIKEILINY